MTTHSMETDIEQLKCEEEIFDYGNFFINLGFVPASIVNDFCNKINDHCKDRARVDWHFQGGRTIMLYVGDWEIVREAFGLHVFDFVTQAQIYKIHKDSVKPHIYNISVEDITKG